MTNLDFQLKNRGKIETIMKENNIPSDEKIINALLELMDEKDYQDISIKDIAEKANVSRITYYRHFQSKDEIVSRFFTNLKNRFVNTISLDDRGAPKDNEVTILALFLFIKANMNANKVLIKSGLENELLKFLSTEFSDNLPIKLDKYMALFVSGALYNVIINWVNNDCKDLIEEVSRPFLNIQSYKK